MINALNFLFEEFIAAELSGRAATLILKDFLCTFGRVGPGQFLSPKSRFVDIVDNDFARDQIMQGQTKTKWRPDQYGGS